MTFLFAKIPPLNPKFLKTKHYRRKLSIYIFMHSVAPADEHAYCSAKDTPRTVVMTKIESGILSPINFPCSFINRTH